MTEKNLNEIVVLREDVMPKVIYENMKMMFKGRYREYDDEQKKNLLNLAALLYFDNLDDSNEPIIANLPMGEGKSILTAAYLRTMYDRDPDFGAIVVKKTLQECKDFCIDLGLNCKPIHEMSISEVSALREKFENGEEDEFIARNVRGFNFSDCIEYEPLPEICFGTPSKHYRNYDYRICCTCHHQCAARKSKLKSLNHRIIVITHERLFFSNDNIAFFEDLFFFNNDKNRVKRRMLIIDEKIDMCNVSGLSFSAFMKIKDRIYEYYNQHSELFEDISLYLNSLKYNEDMQQPIVKQTDFYKNGEGIEFDEALVRSFFQNPSIDRTLYEGLIILERILNSENITTAIPYRFGDSKEKADREGRKLEREIFTNRYINLNSYSERFDKTIILDATADIDYDYQASNAILYCNWAWHDTPICIYTPKFDLNTSKAHILASNIKKMNQAERDNHYHKKINSLAEECNSIINTNMKKTLIVVYKDIRLNKTYTFKKDFIDSLNRQCDSRYFEVIHHQEFITGVNHLKEYEQMIVIGFLNKSSTFYENKKCTLISDFEANNIQTIIDMETNDYLVSLIQQIGRTAYRDKKPVNVYLLSKLELIESICLELNKKLFIEQIEFENSFYRNEPRLYEGIMNLVSDNHKDYEVNSIISINIMNRYREEIGASKSYLGKDYVVEELEKFGLKKIPYKGFQITKKLRESSYRHS